MAVLITHRPVTMDPDVFEAAPISFEITFLFLPKSASHAYPRLFDDEFADLAGYDRFAVFVKNIDIHSGTRSGEGTRFLRQQRIAHQYSARDLGASRIVRDGKFAISHVFE